MNNRFTFLSKLGMAVRAFREAFLTANTPGGDFNEDFEDYGARLVRYAINWSTYDNTMFRNIHSWVKQYKSLYSLYEYIRNIYNPSYRAVEFWKMVIWGGWLDPNAGEEGAVPIDTKNDNLRTAIAKTWLESNWAVNKDITVLWGAALGDVGIKIVDDVNNARVYIENIHPSLIKDVTVDNRGFVRAYELEEIRIKDNRRVVFNERCWRTGDTTINYETLLDGAPFAWNGVAARWSEEYGFVPFVFIPHISVGRRFGWAEMHAARSKINEIEDLSSMVHDYIRKAINPLWLFNFAKPKRAIDFRGEAAAPTTSMPDPGREETSALYVNNPTAKGQALVTDMVDITKAASECAKLIEELERDFPELQMDIWSAGGYTTGKALKNARKRVERKVIQRRPTYDTNLVRAQQMAVAIGGFRGYMGYEGFTLESFEIGDLDHSIPTTRKIFDIDVFEEISVKQTFWTVVIQAAKQKLPVDEVLKDLGWSESRIKDFMEKMKPDAIGDTSVKNQPQSDSGKGVERDVQNI